MALDASGKPAQEDKLADIQRRIEAVRRLEAEDAASAPPKFVPDLRPYHRRQGLPTISWALALQSGVDARLLPGAALHLGAAARLQIRGSELELEGAYLPAVALDDDGDQLTLSGWSVALRGWWLLASSRIRLRVGLGPVVGRLSGDSRGIVPDFERRLWWAGLRGGVATQLRLYRHFFIELALDGQLNLGRPKFTRSVPDGPSRQIHRPPWTSLRSMIGLGVDFLVKP